MQTILFKQKYFWDILVSKYFHKHFFRWGFEKGKIPNKTYLTRESSSNVWNSHGLRVLTNSIRITIFSVSLKQHKIAQEKTFTMCCYCYYFIAVEFIIWCFQGIEVAFKDITNPCNYLLKNTNFSIKTNNNIYH